MLAWKPSRFKLGCVGTIWSVGSTLSNQPSTSTVHPAQVQKLNCLCIPSHTHVTHTVTAQTARCYGFSKWRPYFQLSISIEYPDTCIAGNLTTPGSQILINSSLESSRSLLSNAPMMNSWAWRYHMIQTWYNIRNGAWPHFRHDCSAWCRHAIESRMVPLNSSQRGDSNEL